MEINNIVEIWNSEKANYEKLGKKVCSFIKKEITEFEILPEITYRTKDLLSIIKKIKKKEKEKEYSYSSLNDKLGLRIICSFQEEMQNVDGFLKKYFIIRKVEYKQENLNYDKLDYISNHYDVSINSSVKEFNKLKHLKDLIFEIQVRTLNQHAWSNAAHSISYKKEGDINPKTKRRIYRLLSLYELADDEFSNVHNELKSESNLPYMLLKSFEGKFYKYAKVDFDLELSLFNINILLNYFKDLKSEKEFTTNIEKFISKNESKIINIYRENKNRLYNQLFLTQPEIFLIWYMIENYYFLINDNWSENFEQDDLDFLQVLWGKNL